MPKIRESSTIAAPVAEVWNVVRDFNSLPKWFPGVTDSYVEDHVSPHQVGCVRNFGLEGGARIREQLVMLSDRDRICNYKMLESPLPVRNYVATVRLEPAQGNSTHIELTSQFDVNPAEEKETMGFLSGTYRGAFELLQKYLAKRRP